MPPARAEVRPVPAWSAAAQRPAAAANERLIQAGLILAVLACALPGLNPVHTLPLPSFYEEWLTAALSLAACALVLSGVTPARIVVPGALVPLAGFAIVLAAQTLVVPLAYPQHSSLVMLFVVLARAMLWCGAQLRAAAGLERTARALAWAVSAGGVLGALAALLQAYAPESFAGPVLAPLEHPRVHGNIGQPNLLANQLSIAAVSLFYLHRHCRLRAGWVLALLLPVLLASALTGSRTLWIYGAWTVLWTVIQAARTNDRSQWNSILQIIAYLGLLAAASAALPAPRMAVPGEAQSALERLVAMGKQGADANPDGYRPYFWRQAWAVGMNAPLLGAGIGQFQTTFLEQPPASAESIAPRVERNAHNLILHLIAETGMAGTACVIIALLIFAVRLWRAPPSPHTWWIGAAVGVMLVHSLLEYPLWHAHFLVPFALLCGLADPSPRGAAHGRAWRVAGMAASIGSAFVLASLLHGYVQLRAWVFTMPAETLQDPAVLERQQQVLERLERSMLKPHVDLVRAAQLPVNTERLAEKLAFNDRVMRFTPIPPIMLRQVVYLSLAERDEEARRLLDVALLYYPAEHAAFAADLDRLARRGMRVAPIATYLSMRTGNN